MTKVKMAFALALTIFLAACAPVKIDLTGVTAIIDTRTTEEFDKSHIVGAINIPYDVDFIANSTNLYKSGKYLVYGETADQVGEAKSKLADRGVWDVTNVGNFDDAKRLLPLGVTN